jgi:hypothetical protein
MCTNAENAGVRLPVNNDMSVPTLLEFERREQLNDVQQRKVQGPYNILNLVLLCPAVNRGCRPTMPRSVPVGLGADSFSWATV